VAIILLLGAAFDVLPWTDNLVIFVAVSLFIVAWMVSKISKSSAGEGTCCKQQ
jgi:hypothetical protein